MFIQRLAKSAFCAVTLIVCGSIVMGQAMSPEERQRIIRVQDVEAAGNSGDQTFIPFLKDVLQSRKLDHQNWDRVQMALAKLGEREEQQEIVLYFLPWRQNSSAECWVRPIALHRWMVFH